MWHLNWLNSTNRADLTWLDLTQPTDSLYLTWLNQQTVFTWLDYYLIHPTDRPDSTNRKFWLDIKIMLNDVILDSKEVTNLFAINISIQLYILVIIFYPTVLENQWNNIRFPRNQSSSLSLSLVIVYCNKPCTQGWSHSWSIVHFY